MLPHLIDQTSINRVMLAAFRIPILSGVRDCFYLPEAPSARLRGTDYGWTRTPTQRGLSPNLGLLSFFVLFLFTSDCLTFYPLCFDPFLVHSLRTGLHVSMLLKAARRLLTIWKSEFREDEAYFCAMLLQALS